MVNSSSADFNEPEFPEYDPTPYGGGYDISITYGKPLPPSDKICYPHSLLTKNSHSLPQDKIDPTPIKLNGSPLPSKTRDFKNEPVLDTPIESNSGEKSSESEYDYSPNGYNSPIEENGYYDYEKQLPIPSSDEGCYDVPWPSSEYVEPCATLFGYWPCLLKEYQKNVGQRGCREQGYAYEWKQTEDYIFGSSCHGQYQYGARRGDGIVGDFHYGYNRHHVEQPRCVKYVEKPTYVQEEYNVEEPSYLQYVEQPSYSKNDEQSNYVQGNYNVEEPSYLQYKEQPSYEQEEYNVEQPSYLQYVEQPSYVKNMEQPSYEQEEYNVEQPSYLQYVEQPSYVKNMERPSYVQEEYKLEQPSYLQYVEQPSYARNMEKLSYAQEEYDVEQPSYFQYVEQPSYVENMEQPSYVQEEYNVEQPSYLQYVNQPSYVQDEYNQKLWSQTLNNSYYESYQEA